MRHRNILSLAFAILAIPLLSAGTEPQWAMVKDGSLTSSLKVTGRIIPQDDAQSLESARVQGRITSIYRKEGEFVAQGTPLFGISSADCLSLVQEKDTAQKMGLQEMSQAAERREKQLGLSLRDGDCRLLASHSGTLTKRQVELGSAFNVGDPLANIVDIHKLAVELDIPEGSLYQVRPNQAVQFELASYPGQKISGVIKNILPYIDTSTRTSKARLVPMELPSGTTPNLLVFGDIQTDTQQPILIVPSASLVFSKDKQYVVKQAAPLPISIPVEVLNESDNVSMIRATPESGLAAGDQVAAQGAVFLFKKLNPE